MESLREIVVPLARNPIGIIGLFLVLVYGLAVLASRSSSLPDRRILTWFLVSFPPVVLLAFVYLVVFHHEKLYSPSDFKSDRTFLSTLDSRIRESPKVLEIEEILAALRTEVANQPMYRYTKLSEEGKLLILTAVSNGEVKLDAFADERSLDIHQLRQQAAILESEYGWISGSSGSRVGRTVSRLRNEGYCSPTRLPYRAVLLSVQAVSVTGQG